MGVDLQTSTGTAPLHRQRRILVVWIMLKRPSEHTGRPFSASTINDRVRGVLRLYTWAVRHGWLHNSPLTAIAAGFLLPGALGMVGVTTGGPQSGVCLACDSKVRLLCMSAPQAGVLNHAANPLAISMHSAARKCAVIIDYMLRCCAVSRDVQTWSTKPHSFASTAVMNRSRSRVCSTSSLVLPQCLA